MALPPENQHVTYQLQYRKCGKSSCSTCRDKQGHGPYWYAYWREGTRLRSGYVGKENPYQPVVSNQERDEATAHDTTVTDIASANEQRHTSEPHVAHRAESFKITSMPA